MKHKVSGLTAVLFFISSQAYAGLALPLIQKLTTTTTTNVTNPYPLDPSEIEIRWGVETFWINVFNTNILPPARIYYDSNKKLHYVFPKKDFIHNLSFFRSICESRNLLTEQFILESPQYSAFLTTIFGAKVAPWLAGYLSLNGMSTLINSIQAKPDNWVWDTY